MVTVAIASRDPLGSAGGVAITLNCSSCSNTASSVTLNSTLSNCVCPGSNAIRSAKLSS